MSVSIKDLICSPCKHGNCKDHHPVNIIFDLKTGLKIEAICSCPYHTKSKDNADEY